MMNKVLKYGVWALGGLASLVVFALAVLWAASGAKLSENFDAPETDIAHSTDPVVIAKGERLAAISGCSGCHRERMQGGVFAELPDGTRFIAPNIPRIAAGYSDADLVKVIRYGVKKNGKPVIAMPSEALFSMTDEDLVAILSYIRATPDEGGDAPKRFYGPLARFLLATGKFKSAPAQIEDMSKRPEYDFSDEISHGSYIATIACAECHGLDYKGKSFGPEFRPPDLIVASAYTPEEFAALMKTGIASGGRDLGLMKEVAAGRFAHFSEEEIVDLYAFLRHRAMNPQ